jgi:hypothetical protein
VALSGSQCAEVLSRLSRLSPDPQASGKKMREKNCSSRGPSQCRTLSPQWAPKPGYQACFIIYGPNKSCPVGCVMDYNNTCGGGGGGGAWRYGCKDSPLDACSAKLSHETCNADRGCSWCLSKSKNVPKNVSSCVPLANVSG